MVPFKDDSQFPFGGLEAAPSIFPNIDIDDLSGMPAMNDMMDPSL